MTSDAYLLDTAVLVHWTRNSPQAKAIEQRFALSEQRLRPLICEVSVGEMLAFTKSQNWGTEKQGRLKELLERQTVIVRIGDPRVMEAYADLSTLARTNGWSIFHGKNDLWVGAAAYVAQAHLLTMDRDFLPLREVGGWTITVLDAHTGQPGP